MKMMKMMMMMMMLIRAASAQTRHLPHAVVIIDQLIGTPAPPGSPAVRRPAASLQLAALLLEFSFQDCADCVLAAY